MTMSEAEICKNYSEALDKQKQRGILAELNLCTKKQIDGILWKHGLLEPAPVKASNSKIDHGTAATLHKEGATDREIAEVFGCSMAAVQSWRLRNELRANAEPRRKRAPREKNVPEGCGVDSEALTAGDEGVMAPAARKEEKGITVEIYFPDGVVPCQIRILKGQHGKL